MSSTYPPHRRTPLGRWLRGLGLGEPALSDEARALLLVRRGIRRRASWLVAPLVALAVLAVLAWPSAFQSSDRARSTPWPLLCVLAAGTVTLMTWREIVQRHDLRAGRTLVHRVSRPAVPSLITVLGRGPLVALVLATALAPVSATGLFLGGPPATGWTFLGVVLASFAFAVIGIARARTRATIAVDAFTLAVDERLRSTSAAAACVPVVFGLDLAAVAVHPSLAIALVVQMGPILIMSLLATGWSRDRQWSPPPRGMTRPPKAPLPLTFR